MTEQIIYPQQISMPYNYAAGVEQRAFLRGLVAKRILASVWQNEVLVPARPFGPDGSRTDALVEVGPAGVVEGWTTVPGEGDERTYGLIRPDGATSTMLHLLDVPPEALKEGLRVRPRWAEGVEPEITAIEAFEVAE